ncbi:MAG: phenylalanine--tRNA ligase subunit beta [Clostridia bacterium]|nr:phenylalanine--tRNA ligase subunit beta [Clostridia bacterium]
MIVTLNWLKDFVDLSGLSTKDIADKFIEIGYEVEEMKKMSKGLDHVKVGKIVKLTRHPNAERLQICTIDIGEKQVQILTAATNVFEGAYVPASLDGAHLPNGAVIKETVMRGEISQGMLCGGEELGVTKAIYPTADVDGIMILDESAVVGQDIADFLGLNDVIFDLKVLPNRPDCQSVVELARELATGLGREFIEPKTDFVEAKKTAVKLDIDVNTPNCGVYLGCVIKNVNIAPSPAIIQKRLKSIGINPKNNFIDLTNYILWEMGQPLHAFDYEKLGGKIFVRQAQEGEKLIALDDKTYTLSKDDVVITNDKQVIGLAGIMGGKEFSINPNTHTVVLESAIFDRVSIRRSARAIGLRTDASARFERGVESVSALRGLNRALHLIEEFQLGEIEPIVICGEVETKSRTICVSLDSIKDNLGIEIPAQFAINTLKSLGIKATKKNNVINCEVPAIRADIERDVDLIEEIIRFYGFDKIQPQKCEGVSATIGGVDGEQNKENIATRSMLALGAHQIRTYTFRSPTELDKLLIEKESELRNVITIANPLSKDYSIMRTEMLGSVLDVVRFNLNRQNKDFQLFEVGKVFVNKRNDKNLFIEQNMLSYITTQKVTFFDVKSTLEIVANNLGITLNYEPINLSFMHPNMTASLKWANKTIGLIGKIHPQVLKNFDINTDCYYFELNLSVLPLKKSKKIKPIPKHPASMRDLAVLVNENVAVGELVNVINRAGGEWLENAELFDVYIGNEIDKGKKNVAFKLTFRKPDVTMTQDEVNITFDNIVRQLTAKFDAKLRG